MFSVLQQIGLAPLPTPQAEVKPVLDQLGIKAEPLAIHSLLKTMNTNSKDIGTSSPVQEVQATPLPKTILEQLIPSGTQVEVAQEPIAVQVTSFIPPTPVKEEVVQAPVQSPVSHLFGGQLQINK